MALDGWGTFGYEQGDLVRVSESGVWGRVEREQDFPGPYGALKGYLVVDASGAVVLIAATDLAWCGDPAVCSHCGAVGSPMSLAGTNQVGEPLCERCALVQS